MSSLFSLPEGFGPTTPVAYLDGVNKLMSNSKFPVQQTDFAYLSADSGSFIGHPAAAMAVGNALALAAAGQMVGLWCGFVDAATASVLRSAPAAQHGAAERASAERPAPTAAGASAGETVARAVSSKGVSLARPRASAALMAKIGAAGEPSLAARRPAGLAQPRQDRADDLTRISGIGPKLEKVLNELGIFHFDQIAAWTVAEAGWIGDHLRFPGRVERDNWIGQASALAAGGTPDAHGTSDRKPG